MSVNIDNVQRSNQQERCQFKWLGFYRALVLSAEDPRLLGRVLVRIPSLMPETGDDDCGPYIDRGLWALPANNCLGGRNYQDTMGQRADFEDAWFQGSCMIPPKGSWVFVFFENGDPNHPYYFAGGDFGQRKVLPECQEGQEYWKKWVLFKSNAGRCIVISDDDATDARIEITGKKRMMGNPPDGDTSSVYLVDDNMTTIFIDERPGEERLFIKDYRGNYIVFHTNDSVGKDQLHIFFKGDIRIETLKNLYIKTGEKLQVDVGSKLNVSAGESIDTTATTTHSETAMNFNRVAYAVDNRMALAAINETALGTYNQVAIADMKIGTYGNMDLTGLSSFKLKSKPPIMVDPGINETEVPLTLYRTISDAATAAMTECVNGCRGQSCAKHPAPEPIVPCECMESDCSSTCSNHEVTQCYNAHVGCGASEDETQIKPTIVPKKSCCGSSSNKKKKKKKYSCSRSISLSDNENRKVGVGHAYALCLKKQYWEKIPPLVYKSHGSYTGFYAFKNYHPDMIDYEFIDTDVVPVYNNYENPDWNIDINSKWWTNLREFCELCKSYQITVIPSLFDFYGSHNDPFLKHIFPYHFDNWDVGKQGEYVRNFVNVLKETKVDFILNLGVRQYRDGYPTPGYLRNLVMYLVNELGVSSNYLSLSDSLSVESPYCNYKTVYDETVPGMDMINLEEVVDGEIGGSASSSIFDEEENLIGGYAKLLIDSSEDGILCMNNWKMSMFKNRIPDGMDINHPNVMNYIFAPNQREATRMVLSDMSNDGFIDFSED
jgi:hypothetical protein